MGKKRRKGAGRKRKPAGFEIYTTYRRCEDCDLRNALDVAGRPIFLKWHGVPLTSGCEGCGGTGKVKEELALDPYLDRR